MRSISRDQTVPMFLFLADSAFHTPRPSFRLGPRLITHHSKSGFEKEDSFIANAAAVVGTSLCLLITTMLLIYIANICDPFWENPP
jgi:hypothetical protein